MNRETSYAGSFYPDNPDNLKKDLKHYLKGQNDLSSNSNCLGIICPHAGYVYSGQTAGVSYAYCQKNKYKNVIIIAPSHQYFDHAFSVSDYDYFNTPLGPVKVNKEICSLLKEENKFKFNQTAERSEHSLEVQLPFIKTLFPELKIIPILFSQQNLDNALYLLDKLSELLSDSLEDNLYIISSDFSHYHSSSVAEAMDRQAIELICNLDSERFFLEIQNRKIEACGFGGILFMMELAKKLSINRAEFLDYSHSGMINFDNQRVVGYSSIAFNKE